MNIPPLVFKMVVRMVASSLPRDSVVPGCKSEYATCVETFEAAEKGDLALNVGDKV